jgi:hypothetical protein
MKPTKHAPLEVARAATLNKKLALGSIGVLELSAKLSFTMNLQPVSCVSRPGDVIAVYPLRVIVEHVDGEARLPLAELSVSMRASYRKFPSFTNDDEAAVPHYVGIVGWMHVWPYLRAEVQSLSTKLDQPPLVLPVLLSGQTAEVPVEMHDASSLAPTPATPAAPTPKPPRTRAKRSR